MTVEKRQQRLQHRTLLLHRKLRFPEAQRQQKELPILNYPWSVTQPPSQQEHYLLFFFQFPFCTYKLTDDCREAKTLATWLMTKNRGPTAATSRGFRHCAPTQWIAQPTCTQKQKESQNRVEELESSNVSQENTRGVLSQDIYDCTTQSKGRAQGAER